MLEFGRAALYNNSFVLDSACRVQREVRNLHFASCITQLVCTQLSSSLLSLFLQLPKRLARRLMDLQFLPYIVVTNPHIKRVYDSYQHAFETLHNLPQVKTVEQNAEFTVLLKRLVDEHGQSPSLAARFPQLEHYTASHTASDKPFVNLHHLDRQYWAAMSAAIVKSGKTCAASDCDPLHAYISSAAPIPTSWPTAGFQRAHISADHGFPSPVNTSMALLFSSGSCNTSSSYGWPCSMHREACAHSSMIAACS